jgi:prepilin-type N-terminal cleavage/methylation domain-containing protein
MNKIIKKNGFTLPEVLISLAVLTMVIVAATNLVVSIVRTNTDNINTLIAYGLAQEGIEGFRNIRDSNWLLGAGFDGKIKGTDAWGVDLSGSASEEQYFVIDLLKLNNATDHIISEAGQISSFAPWKITKISKNVLDTDATLIKKFLDGESFRYGHLMLSNSEESQDTLFHRYLILEGDSEKMKVTSVVTWEEYGRKRFVNLTTELTDWNQGQI